MTPRQQMAFESYSLSGGRLDGEVFWFDRLKTSQPLSVAYGLTRKHLLVLDGETIPRVMNYRSFRLLPKRRTHYARVSRGTVLIHVRTPDSTW